MTKEESLDKAAQEFNWKNFYDTVFNFFANDNTTRQQLDEVIHRAMEIYANAVVNEINEWKE